MSKSEKEQFAESVDLERYVTKTDLKVLENRMETQIIRAENKILAIILGVIVFIIFVLKLP